MAKNAVTDWSPTDSLNTDIGGTNIAEGCAPGGINDAIRKLMAQIATYITDALQTVVRVGDSAFKLWLNGSNPRVEFDANDYLTYDRTANSFGVAIGGATCHTVSAATTSIASGAVSLNPPAANGTLQLYSSAVLKARVRTSGSGILLTSSDAYQFANLTESTNYLTLTSLGAIFGNDVTVNGAFTAVTPVSALQDAQVPRLDFNRSGVAVWHLGGSGTPGDNSFNLWLNSLPPVISVDTGSQTVTTSGAVKAGGGLSTTGMIRASGTGLTGLSTGAAVELIHDGTAGTVLSYNRGTSAHTSIGLSGTNVNLQPQGGIVSSQGNHNVQGILSLGGSALSGISGQVQFNTAAGAANVANISWQGGNDLRLTNTQNGSISFYIVNAERLRVTNSLVASDLVIRSGYSGTGIGAVQIAPGSSTATGYVEFLNSASVSQGYIQQTINADINYFNQNAAAGHYFTGAYLSVRKNAIGGVTFNVGSGSATGKFVMTDTVGNPCGYIGGQTIGQPTSYSNGNGHGFDSSVTITGNLTLNGGGVPQIALSTGGGTLWQPAANTLCMGGSGTTERARIDGSGYMTVRGPRGGTGTTAGSGSLRVVAAAAGDYAISTYDTQDYTALQFVRDVGGGASQNGSITVGVASITVNYSSDARRKTNFRDFDSGDLVDRLNFGTFEWTPEFGGATAFGVLAQDAHEVFPEAITVGDEETPWAADYSKFVPIAMAELKKLRARVAELEGAQNG